MPYDLILVMVCVGLFLIMAIMPYFGYRIALWQAKKGFTVLDNGSIGVVMSALFALLGLLIAFTFSGAFSRFDERRQIIVEEISRIGTAYSRLELLDSESKQILRRQFRQYVESRSRIFPLLINREAVIKELDHTAQLQNEIWTKSVAVTEDKPYRDTRTLLLPALNQMFDITTVRTIAIQTHPPPMIFVVLCVIAMVSSGMVGYSVNTNKKYQLSSAHVVGFAGVVAFVLYVILDVEFPRIGFVTLESVNDLFIKLIVEMDAQIQQ